jgi:uncharacterized membrane protein
MKSNIKSWEDKMEYGIKGVEPLVTLFSGSYLLYLAIHKRNYPLGIAGGFLLFKAGKKIGKVFSKKLLGAQTPKNVEVRSELIVNSPRKEVYEAWRKFENLPLFMEHLNHVEVLDEKRSNWEISLPGHMGTLSWVSEIEKDVEGKEIKWKSEKGAYLETSGEVKFQDEKENQTLIKVKISYQPPFGVMSEAISHLLTPFFEEMVKEDIQNFKNYMEAHQDYRKKSSILDN